MKHIKFTEKITIHASAEIIFDVTQDYAQRLRWDTFLKQAELIEGAERAGKGVKAYCAAKNGMGMVTEYVTFNRPKATAINMTKGPYMFESFLGSWNYKHIGENETEVIFLYAFSLRFPFNLIWKIVENNLQRNVRQRLLDLKKYIETN
ncbi:type II toxin-antitoxin system RatA family toxin [Cytophaga hutchinsonii]|jgi:ribosome-associated toxin RatA of RatAB toxin-antitoxin module|uniref:SRPBCC family protein n=1 Tax=Cytophaga hutchinsonii (strain ATCC 33406 / DSM 1761 / CIP 103989 / NBRC 15051 / NCIMB 9469 / D465) TaxID=269798 RepID=A0A6N4ST70_CYTH3|nr:SRPBCC family protein [Cytophaga hutchinsonii]ABG59489.1 conserved hypothetical protein [Cytophaga hutchinsonii ATCC 33406]SFX94025.1 Polyketide cyclase / dehydrase and lipid transport [Cytophaga hutchinsonii ATCC 33406]